MPEMALNRVFDWYTWGAKHVATVPIPESFREPLWKKLCRLLDIDLTEVELPLCAYPRFQDLFARTIKPDLRPIDSDAVLVSPVDGCLITGGALNAQTLIQAKGKSYALQDLLGDAHDQPTLSRELEGGCYLTFHLRPKDYHRIHAPADMVLERVKRIPGGLYPVAPWSLKLFDDVFVKNERVVFEGTTAHGKLALVCVGATGVGTIATPHLDAPTSSNPHLQNRTDVTLAKGDEIAQFLMGSTVIIAYRDMRATSHQAMSHQILPSINGQSVRFGESIYAQPIPITQEWGSREMLGKRMTDHV